MHNPAENKILPIPKETKFMGMCTISIIPAKKAVYSIITIKQMGMHNKKFNFLSLFLNTKTPKKAEKYVNK